MPDRPDIQPLALTDSPEVVSARWPVDRPLLTLRSPDVARPSPWARWSILASPQRWFRHAVESLEGDPLDRIRQHLAATGIAAAAGEHPVAPPFRGGWIGWISYDLGRHIEPSARHVPSARDDRGWPLIELAWCPAALVFDHRDRVWYRVGGADVPAGPVVAQPAAPRLGAAGSSLSRDAYVGAVRRIRRYIADGDVFQANLTQRFTVPFAGSTRSLARSAMRASRAWYGASLELPDGRAIISMSPELYLAIDGATRAIVTRPIKGTRSAQRPPSELLESEKDTAELHMIVDLMRNDLGRVCRFGTVRVPAARVIESHPTVHHGVGEVRGTLRDGVDLADVLRATFPPGSVTGAPKIRAMQIIDELEPVRRGPYCGAIGFIGTDGSACFSVAIRTIQCTGTRPPGRMDMLDGRLDYGAGGGIVADSDPEAEYRESLDKAAVLRIALGLEAGPPGAQHDHAEEQVERLS